MLLVAALLAAGCASPSEGGRADAPDTSRTAAPADTSYDALAPAVRAALDQFTGRWRGPFVARAADGTITDSLTADHRYWWDGRVQRGRLIDRYPDGRVLHATARNFVRNDTLYCVVEPEGGGKPTVLRGRVEGGAVIWHRRGAGGGRVESYRERVVSRPEGPAYWIDGFGAYPGDDTFLHFIGRYRRVPIDSSTAG